jgi:parallel beta-helix repeat protein
MSGAAASTHAGSVIVPDQFPTIQEAVDSGAPSILVRPGVYAETPVITRDLDLLALVQPGTPPDSVPVVAGLLFDDLPGELIHTHYTRIEGFRFTAPVRNDYQSSPYWDPFVITFAGCVFEAGMHDSTATEGGQLEYYFGGCTFDGPLRLAYPQTLVITSSELRAPIIVGRAGYTNVEMLVMARNRLIGPGDVGVDLLSAQGGEIRGNTIQGFGIGIRHRGSGDVVLIDNTITGPGRYGIHSSTYVSVHGSRISGFEIGILKDGSSALHREMFSSRNRIEGCTTSGMSVVTNYLSSERDTILSSGTGMALTVGSDVLIRHALILGCAADGIALAFGGGEIDSNVIGRCGGDGIDATLVPLYDNPVRVKNNTSYLNAGSGFALALTGATRSHEVLRNIGYGNQGHGLALSGTDSVTRSCNDWFENMLGAVSGIDPAPTDLAVDPAFCDFGADDVALRSDSPLAHAVGCGLVGARSVGCDTTTTPVLVARFEAWHGDGGAIVIGWIVHLDPPRLVRLERAFAREGPWTPVQAARESHGDLVTLVDREADPRRSHEYRLVDDRDVVLAWTRVDGATPLDFALEPPAANPGPGPFEIRFVTPRASAVDVAVFDIQGRFVARLASGNWPAETGLHFVRYRFPGGEATRRISVVR